MLCACAVPRSRVVLTLHSLGGRFCARVSCLSVCSCGLREVVAVCAVRIASLLACAANCRTPDPERLRGIFPARGLGAEVNNLGEPRLCAAP